MLNRLDSSDWECVFDMCHGGRKPSIENLPGDSVSTDQFTREDVDNILAIEDGGNDGPEWIVIVYLKDGRYASIAAGCDFTGWDCQAYGGAIVSNDLKDIWFLGTTADARERFLNSFDTVPELRILV
jgi:hypothetical protein